MDMDDPSQSFIINENSVQKFYIKKEMLKSLVIFISFHLLYKLLWIVMNVDCNCIWAHLNTRVDPSNSVRAEEQLTRSLGDAQ